jgi:fatty-acid desaturase
MTPADRCAVNTLIERPGCSPVDGVVRWDPVHSLWNGTMLAGALVLAPLLFSWSALAVFLLLTGASLLLGHSVGFHRRLIHRSFECPLWLERILVWIGTCVGISGPFWMIRTHDLRDWAQRQPDCHDYLAHRRGPQSWLVDEAGVQAHDVPWAAIPTMGEAWHNNHHAFPGSARIGLYPGQSDWGFAFILALERLGLASNIVLPESLPHRKALRRVAGVHAPASPPVATRPLAGA